MAKTEKANVIVAKQLLHEVFADLKKPMRTKSKLLDFNSKIPRLSYSKQDVTFRGTKTKVVKYVSAIGEEQTTYQSKLKEQTDPYLSGTRDDFTNSAYTDPTVAPSLEQRHNAFFENGFTLALVLKNTINPTNGKEMTDDEIKKALEGAEGKYGQAFAKIKQWALSNIDVNLHSHMKTHNITNVVQGRSMTLFSPPLSLLKDGELPTSLTTITTEETGNPIVDVLQRKMVAIRVDLGNKKFALPDEIVYTIRKQWGLRKDSLFFGASSLESVVQVSKAFKRLCNFDIPKAVVAGYLTKIIAKISATGSPAQQQSQIDSILAGIIDDGTDIIGVSADIDLKDVRIQIDHDIIKICFDILDELLMSAAGSTKAQLGRTANLNRDTATIMEIANIKYIRSPDEELVSTAFENQLLNPLFSHLTEVDINELPVKIAIVRKEHQETSISDERLEKKANDIDDKAVKNSDQAMKQDDARNTDIGA